METWEISDSLPFLRHLSQVPHGERCEMQLQSLEVAAIAARFDHRPGDVAYAVGEFARTQPAPDRTLVRWTYRFALREEVGDEDRSRFQNTFLGREFPEWMRTQLDRKPAESDTPDS